MSHVEPRKHAERSGSPLPRFAVGRHHYVRAHEPIHFPSEESLEEAVSETKRHLEARTMLYLLLKGAFAGHAIGSEQFVYSDAADPRKCLSPDVFVKTGSRDNDFDTWKVWERGAPDLAVEIISASDRRDEDWAEKMERYHAAGIRELVRFDPLNAAQPIRIWDRVDGDLMERAPESTLLRECTTLGLFWAVVPSPLGPQLRLARDAEGRDLLETPDEKTVRLVAELAEERRARMVAEHERLLEAAAKARAEQRALDEAAAKAVAEQRALDEAAAKAVAEQRALDEAAAKARAEQRALDEAAAKAVAERERDEALEELRRLRAELARRG